MEGVTVEGPGENVPEEPGLGADLGSLPAQESRFQTVLSMCNKGPVHTLLAQVAFQPGRCQVSASPATPCAFPFPLSASLFL